MTDQILYTDLDTNHYENVLLAAGITAEQKTIIQGCFWD